MTDFTRLKMGFSVALLAALFMIRPLLDQVAENYFVFLGYKVYLQYLYYLFAGCLSLSAYFFALELLSGKSAAPFAQRAGNTTYALAILMPPAFTMVYIIALIGNTLGNPRSAFIVDVVLTVVLLFIVMAVMLSLRRAISDRDRSFSISKLGDEETANLAKASGLLEAGLYDLVVIQAFQTLETSLRRLLLARGVYPRRNSVKDLVITAQGQNLVSDEVSRCIHDVRVLRNEVVHEGKSVNRDTAEIVIDETRKVITRFGMLLSEEIAEDDSDSAA